MSKEKRNVGAPSGSKCVDDSPERLAIDRIVAWTFKVARDQDPGIITRSL